MLPYLKTRTWTLNSDVSQIVDHGFFEKSSPSISSHPAVFAGDGFTEHSKYMARAMVRHCHLWSFASEYDSIRIVDPSVSKYWTSLFLVIFPFSCDLIWHQTLSELLSPIFNSRKAFCWRNFASHVVFWDFLGCCRYLCRSAIFEWTSNRYVSDLTSSP